LAARSRGKNLVLNSIRRFEAWLLGRSIELSCLAGLRNQGLEGRGRVVRGACAPSGACRRGKRRVARTARLDERAIRGMAAWKEIVYGVKRAARGHGGALERLNRLRRVRVACSPTGQGRADTVEGARG